MVVREEAVKINGTTTNYNVTSDGDIINIHTDNTIKAQVSHSGMRVMLKLGAVNQNINVARIVMESFIGLSDNPDEKFIGYLDGDASNAKLDNLFWTIYRQWWIDPRVEYSPEIITRVKTIFLKFPNMTFVELSKYLKISRLLIADVIARHGGTADTVLDEGVSEVPLESNIDESTVFDQMPDIAYSALQAPPESNFDDTVVYNGSDTERKKYHQILWDDIPALKYAGVSPKKIMKYVLYRYGKDVYEYFKSNYDNMAPIIIKDSDDSSNRVSAFHSFIDGRCVIDVNVREHSDVLEHTYKNHCRELGVVPESRMVFHSRMKSLDGLVYSRFRENGDNKNGYTGIALNTDV